MFFFFTIVFVANSELNDNINYQVSENDSKALEETDLDGLTALQTGKVEQTVNELFPTLISRSLEEHENLGGLSEEVTEKIQNDTQSESSSYLKGNSRVIMPCDFEMCEITDIISAEEPFEDTPSESLRPNEKYEDLVLSMPKKQNERLSFCFYCKEPCKDTVWELEQSTDRNYSTQTKIVTVQPRSVTKNHKEEPSVEYLKNEEIKDEQNSKDNSRKGKTS